MLSSNVRTPAIALKMRIEHIAMYVKDIERTKDFIIKYFEAKSNNGYRNTLTNFKSYFLTFEDGARLAII